MCISIVWTSISLLSETLPSSFQQNTDAWLSNLTAMIPSFVCSVCNKMAKYPLVSSFLCMDLTYIACLLKEGFGFKERTVLQVRQFYTRQPCAYKHTIEGLVFLKGGRGILKRTTYLKLCSSDYSYMNHKLLEDMSMVMFKIASI